MGCFRHVVELELGSVVLPPDELSVIKVISDGWALLAGRGYGCLVDPQLGLTTE